jgi:hypothetical protein
MAAKVGHSGERTSGQIVAFLDGAHQDQLIAATCEGT